MSVSIYFQQFNKEKVDQAWDDIISGKFEQSQRAEKEALEKELPKLQKEIPPYSNEELDFMIYGKDPKLEVYNKAHSKYEDIKEKAFAIHLELMGLDELKAAVITKNKKTILDAIIMVDANLISKYSGQSFYEYYHGEFDLFTQILFSETLNINLKEQEYYKQDSLPGIPFELWVNAFKNIDANTMQNIKNRLDEEGEYTFEDFRDCMLPVKDVIKHCLDTHTEMVVSFENEYSKFQIERAEKIYERLV